MRRATATKTRRSNRIAAIVPCRGTLRPSAIPWPCGVPSGRCYRLLTASATYGMPSEAGARTRPASPASATSAARYGSACISSLGNSHALQRVLQGGEKPEEERRAGCSEGRPTSEDHRGQRDEAAAGRHAVGIEIEFGEREIHAAERCDRAAGGPPTRNASAADRCRRSQRRAGFRRTRECASPTAYD